MDIKQITGNLPKDMEILNPFRMDKVTYISLVMKHRWFSEEFRFVATITFKNGSTTGEQEIEGNDFGDLFSKVVAFCKSL